MQEPGAAVELYLDLLKRVVTHELFIDEELVDIRLTGFRERLYAPARRLLARRGLRLVAPGACDRVAREFGRDWPPTADTMVGLRRLDNLHGCIRMVIEDDVPGDLIETGAWRGGASIFMRAVLAAYGDEERRVWVADSFQGLPKPDPHHFPADASLDLSGVPYLAVSLDEVRARFERYGMLDKRVMFLQGWFRDTLPTAPIDQLAVLRLDGDYYESTIEALDTLYPKLSLGGFVIVDDYGVIPACRRAVEDYRASHGIDEPIEEIDGSGVYWRRLRTLP